MKHREEFLKEMKETLLAKQRELQDLLTSITEGGEQGNSVKDSADEASSTVMNRLQSSLQATEVQEMRLIEEALVRIDNGEYGICVNCGEPIVAKRLEYYPYAARCISCQELFEG